jgi:hypothetical protein
VVGADPHLNLVTDTVDVLPLTEQGVIVALYAFRTGETVIGHGVRYIRNETSSYTRADVMLVKWNPVK